MSPHLLPQTMKENLMQDELVLIFSWDQMDKDECTAITEEKQTVFCWRCSFQKENSYEDISNLQGKQLFIDHKTTYFKCEKSTSHRIRAWKDISSLTHGHIWWSYPFKLWETLSKSGPYIFIVTKMCWFDTDWDFQRQPKH